MTVIRAIISILIGSSLFLPAVSFAVGETGSSGKSVVSLVVNASVWVSAISDITLDINSEDNSAGICIALNTVDGTYNVTAANADEDASAFELAHENETVTDTIGFAVEWANDKDKEMLVYGEPSKSYKPAPCVNNINAIISIKNPIIGDFTESGSYSVTLTVMIAPG